MISLGLLRSGHIHDEAESGCPQCESVTTTIRECGHCGTPIAPDAESCPACDRVEVVEYSI